MSRISRISRISSVSMSEGMDMDIASHFPLLGSKYILSEISSILAVQHTRFNPMDEFMKIAILDYITSKMVDKMLLLLPTDGSGHSDSDCPTKHTLSMQANKELVTFGFIREHSSSFIPVDVMRYILSIYNDCILWSVRGESMNKFLSKETVHGPQFEIAGILEGQKPLVLELELSHKEHDEFVSCYLVSSAVPKGIKSILISFTLYLEQLRYECRSTMCYEDEDDAKGWNALGLSPFLLSFVCRLFALCVLGFVVCTVCIIY